jgi:hypothetical protein
VSGGSDPGARPTVDSPSDGRYTPFRVAGIAQLVEHQLPKLRVAGSSPAARLERAFPALPRSQRPPNSPHSVLRWPTIAFLSCEGKSGPMQSDLAVP